MFEPTELIVGSLPGRKYPMLYAIEDDEIVIVASIKDPAYASLLHKMIDHWVSGGADYEAVRLYRETH